MIEIFTSQDGSKGLYNKELDEVYHSKFGAYKEALEKFVEPCYILNDRPLKILDICYGIGYNTKTALLKLKNIELIDCVEIDKSLVELSAKFPSKSDILENKKVNFYIEDIRSAIKKLDKKYDIIFHDGFCPHKQATVWSQNLIWEISKRLKGLYITYNTSKPVLAALREAGLYLGKTIKENRVIGTVASFDLSLIQNPFNDLELGELKTKSAITYKDKELNLSHSQIIKNREAELQSSKRQTLSSYKAALKRKTL